MEHTMTNIKTQIVNNPHKGNSLCVSVFGVDTTEPVDSYTLNELRVLIDRMQDAYAELRAAQILNSDPRTLYDTV